MEDNRTQSAASLNPAASFNPNDTIAINKEQIDAAIKRAAELPRGVFRICLHESPSAKLHQMLIVLPHGIYIRPKKHDKRIKSYHLIQGEMDLLTFKDDGSVSEHLHMGALESGKPFCFRLAQGIFHTVIPTSKVVVFHEIVSGPFVAEEVIKAPWAPLETDLAEVSAYINTLLK